MLEHPEDALPEGFTDAWLTRRQASAYLASVGVPRTPATLAKLYSTSDDGPPCIHRGRIPFYSKRALHLWAMRQLTRLRRGARERQPVPALDQSGAVS